MNSMNPEAAKEFLQQAKSLQSDGQYDTAVELYIRSIESMPTAEAHTSLGWAYGLMGKFNEAIEECYKAIELDKSYGNPYNDIGSYLIFLGKYDEAKEWLQRAIDTPTYTLKFYSYYNLGGIYEIKGEWSKALNNYKKALDLNPDFKPAYKSVSVLTRLFN